MAKRAWRTRLVGAVLALAVLLFLLSASGVLGLDALSLARGVKAEVGSWVEANPLLASAIYALVYVVFTGLSIPGALFLTLLGGALFGVLWAVVLVSFAATGGATVVFLLTRYLLADWVSQRYGNRYPGLLRELSAGGPWYLLALRLNLAFPYFLVNLLFGLTRMPVWQFWLVSQLGMLPGTTFYAYAGAQLATIESIRDIVSPNVVLALAGLGLVPVALRVLGQRWWRSAGVKLPQTIAKGPGAVPPSKPPPVPVDQSHAG
jgi:uncharacterized membrane protein YdjX (TVP38/TMEM64 family)